VRVLAGAFAAFALGLGGAALGWYWLEATLPDVFSFAAYRRIATEASRIQAQGGEVLATFGPEIRTVVPAERIPKVLRAALVCAEDAAFYSHPGLDLMGIARALWIDTVRGRYSHGASTITQQFAKTRFLSREKTLLRKLRELVLARRLETRLGKDEILTLYANEVYFGHGRYGIEEAARFYFGKSGGEVDVAEAALLAGIVNSPATFSPLRHPDQARRRRTYVLQQMVQHGYLTPADRDRAERTPLPSQGHDARAGVGAWYIEHARRFVENQVGREALQAGGLRITLALDVAVQQAAEKAVADGLHALDAKYKTAEPVRRYADAAELKLGHLRLVEQQAALFADGKAPWGKVIVGIVDAWEPQQAAWRLDLGSVPGWLPAAAVQRYETKLQAGDLVRVSVRDQQRDGWLLSPEFGPQVALIAIEPESRLVRAMVGGDAFGLHPFDRATGARRQPGSTFKIFAYGAALEHGKITPQTEMIDVARTFRSGGRNWTPRNFSGRYDGKSHTMGDAVAQSINSIAVAVAAEVGPERVEEMARRLGIASPLTVGLPLALGASSVTLLELTNAYAAIAAGGRVRPPVFVTRIVDREGKDLWQAPRNGGTKVLRDDVVAGLHEMLAQVVQRGSGVQARKVGRPAAGKTGTSNGGRDAWFVGFTPELCAGVWVGYDDRKPMQGATGGTVAVPIWAQFVKDALDRAPVRPLPRLPHVVAGIAPPPAPDGEQGADVETDSELDDPGLAPSEMQRPPPLLPEL
jgi:penicillin-binding protein 1A